MSEETPEKLEDQAEETAVKKKTVRKRTKAPESKTEEKPPADAKVDPDEKPKSAEKPASAEKSSSEGEKAPAREDGETPTENPSIRRISSKRKTNPDSSDDEGASEQIPTIVEPAAAEAQGKKRRRRRRKGSGGDGDDGGDDGRQSSRPVSRIKLDPEKVEKKAWKIFLSEVSEEGLALVSDQDAKEIGRRSFRLAEIFLEEASKRQGNAD